MGKNGTAEDEYMHESIEKDAVKYDLPSEEIIDALMRDNKQLKAENEKLSEQYDQLHIDFVATKRQLEEENKRFRNALLNIAERSKTANTPDSMSSTARRALSGGKDG